MLNLLKLAAVACILAAAPVQAQKSLSIKGSDTMVNLSQAWAEAFMKSHPSVSISVTGGGSGTGIAAFINGTCDLANCSRAMKQQEINAAKTKGMVATANVVALDGLSIVVNKKNIVQSLTMQQVADIYTGKVTNWSQVGGRPGPIVVLSRESSSGTYAFMREHVMGNQPYRADAQLMPATKSIQQELSNNPNAIGYGGEAYFKGKPNCRIIPISFGVGKKPVWPLDTNVRSGKYPISRPLYVYSKGVATGLAGEFIRFCISKPGQEIVEKIGYVKLH